MTARLEALPPGGQSIMSSRPGPDLTEAGYTETELIVSGTAASYAAEDWPADGRLALSERGTAPFVTRAVLRRPIDATFSGTLVVEWLNVSSGQDSAPGWIYQAEEIVRSGHAWVGVSAQYAGVEGGLSSVQVADLGNPGLRGSDPERYAALTHPGDAFAFDIFTQTALAFTAEVSADCVLAIGESQSAFALTTYVNGVQPITSAFDGFLVHSRGGPALPLGEPGAGALMDEIVRHPPMRLRDDSAAPVLVVVTEGDIFGRINYYPARQPDHERLRVWEVAGTAHADKHLIGEFEEFLGCDRPVNRGQQSFVLRAALRHLHAWARGGAAPPGAEPLATVGEKFVLDDVGNVAGGVRTPAADAPVEVLSGLPAPGASTICRLFGSSEPLPAEALERLYPGGAGDYLAAYTAAADRLIDAGFLLADDRAEILADARPNLFER